MGPKQRTQPIHDIPTPTRAPIPKAKLGAHGDTGGGVEVEPAHKGGTHPAECLEGPYFAKFAIGGCGSNRGKKTKIRRLAFCLLFLVSVGGLAWKNQSVPSGSTEYLN